MIKKIFFITLCCTVLYSTELRAQQLLTDLMDTTTQMGKGLFAMYQQYNALRFSVYVQPQLQVADHKGTQSYDGGDFLPNSNSRLMLRRGRFRAEYLRLNGEQYPVAQIVYQFDATERGVFVRDLFGRIFENKWHLFSLTGGIFARPFGYEVNLSSSDRESPERGRMSQILMKTERDMGFMLSLEPRGRSSKMRWLKYDIGVFNGPGLSGPSDYDSHKDIISRLSIKPVSIRPLNWKISGGISCYYGGINSESPWVYRVKGNGGQAYFTGDSAQSNIGYVAPRQYYGADVQLKIPNRKGITELRAEYIRGRQTATANSSESPGSYPMSGATPQALYTRNFDGAYFYFLQNLASVKHQLIVKYDWYDPNTDVKGAEITSAHGFGPADIKYQTLGAGYIYYINPYVKAVFWFEHVMNEHTALAGYTADVPDDMFTFRLQFRF